MKKVLLNLCVTGLLTFSTFAQTNRTELNRFLNSTQAVITLNELTQTPEFIRFPKNKPFLINGVSLKEKALNFVNNYTKVLGLEPNQFVFIKQNTDQQGFTHVTLQQRYYGVNVFDGVVKIHFNTNKQITAINGNAIPISKINFVPALSQNDAETIAITKLNEQNVNYSGIPVFAHKSDLFVFRKGLVENDFKGNYLVYKVEVRNDNDVREYLFIDAHSGEVVEQFTGMPHALNRVVYENDTNNTVWQEGDAFPGSLDIWQRNEVIASGHVYNFFENTFGFTSYDGADAQMRTINNNPNVNCPNATWNGVTANYCDGTATDDVIAHEWGHAYTEYTSNLIYAYQSGAINESYSDIWGETIDLLNGYEDAGENLGLRTNCGNSLRWRVGEDATAFGGAIRDMYIPTCDGDPGKVTDTQYRCGPGDSGGVHSNSGVPNHAYALLVDGGTYNGQTIIGIGFTKAAHIFWRAQSQYLTSTSDFSVLADALEASANDLLGINLEGLTTTNSAAGPSGEIITASDIQQVVNTILAVEFRINPDACGYQPLLTDDPTLCVNATNSPLFIEDWESGLAGWTATQIPTNPGTWESRDWVVEVTLPKGRAGNGVFGADPINGNCGSDLQNGILRLESPVITTPATNVTDYELAFNHNVSSEFQWDGFNIKYKLNSGAWTLLPGSAFTANTYNDAINTAGAGNDNPLAGEAAFTGSDEGGNTGSWVTSIVNLSGLGLGSNDTIQFRFEVGTDGCNGTVGWYLDEVYVYSCSQTLGVDSFNILQSSIQIFPNPSNGLFTLSNSKKLDINEAVVYDINGRIIQRIDLIKNTDTQQINLTQVANGVYFVKLESSTSSVTFKLIKN